MPATFSFLLWNKGGHLVGFLLVAELRVLSGILSPLVYGNVWKTARSGLGQHCVLWTKGEGFIPAWREAGAAADEEEQEQERGSCFMTN